METVLKESKEPSVNQPETASLRRKFAVCFFAFILIGANDGTAGVLIPSLMAQYNVNKAQISFMFLAATFGYLIAAFSSGLLVERFGRKAFLILGTSAFALSTFTLLTQPPFILFLVALFGLGFGGGILDAGLNAYIASLPNNTKALNYLHAFYGMGALIGPVAASGVLAIGLSWNFTYLIWLVMAVLTFAGFMVVLDNTRSKENGSGEGNVLAAALKIGFVWLTAAFLFVYVGTEVGLGTWSYSFLIEVRHGIELFSAWSISGYWLGLTLGRLVMGRIGEKLGNRRLVELCLGGVVAGVLILWLIPSDITSAIGLLIIGFSLGPIFPTMIAIISDVLPSRVQASAIGFVAAGGSMGAAFFPLIIGNLAQAFGVWILMPYAIVLTVVMLGLWFVLSRRNQLVKA